MKDSLNNLDITISIVTADRIERVEACLYRLSLLPNIDRVKVHVIDNSELHRYQVIARKFYACGRYNWTLSHVKDFIEARNLAVATCKTKWMFILDDDDLLDVNAIANFEDALSKATEETDMISFGVGKVGRIDNFTGDVTSIIVKGRADFLNDFDRYKYDRLNKVYLWNSGHLLRTEALRRGPGWKYRYCDDILPITHLYITAREVLRVNRIICWYEEQNTICAIKTKVEAEKLELNMLRSYEELLDMLTSSQLGVEAVRCEVLLLAVKNSIKQLKHIDNYESKRLLEIYNNCLNIMYHLDLGYIDTFPL